MSSPCFCLPQADYICRYCEGKAQEVDLLGEMQPVREELADLTGYGYFCADQDGFDGGYVMPQDHKDEEFMAAAEQLLHAKEVSA